MASILSVAVLVAADRPAAPHEGAGAIEVVRSDAAGDLTVRYRLRVTFVDDGHGAPEATVTATVLDATGPRTPVAFARAEEDGVYEGTVTYPAPGPWTVRFTSIRPTGSIEHPEQVAAPATTTTAAPSDTTRPPADAGPEGVDRPEGGTKLPLSLAGAVATVGIATAVLLARKRRPERGHHLHRDTAGP